MDFITIIKDIYYCKFNLQQWINHRFNDPTKIILKREGIQYLVTPEGLKFYPAGLETVERVLEEYQFDDLQEDDIVLDLGAHIGAFALRAALKCKHVYAVEPLYPHELLANVILNGLEDKITIFSQCLGTGDTTSIRYENRDLIMQTATLSKILDMTGKITFLKCDVEGAEWAINPGELDGIHRIELETHTCKNSRLPPNPALVDYIEKNWRTEITPKTMGMKGEYIHAYFLDGVK